MTKLDSWEHGESLLTNKVQDPSESFDIPDKFKIFPSVICWNLSSMLHAKNRQQEMHRLIWTFRLWELLLEYKS